MKFVECPQCKGKGKITLTVHTFSNETTSTEEQKFGCQICHGVGKITQAKKMSWDRAWDKFCDCEIPSEEMDFYDDGEHSECSKHHYRCQNCKKITQIG